MEKKRKIVLTKKLITSNEQELEKFYKESLAIGNEGLMLKNLAKQYTPGRRVKGWLKLKPVLEPLDLVIVGATWGEGARTSWLTSYNLACRDPDTGKLLECGMMSTGLNEDEYKQATDMLKPFILQENARQQKA